MPLRRNLKQLQQSVGAARTRRARAAAVYQLAVFHDNNGREAAAIPYYRRAIALGLDGKTQSCALAWLASSLHKTARPAAAMRCLRRALAGPCPPDLRGFLTRLEKRIRRRRRTTAA